MRVQRRTLSPCGLGAYCTVQYCSGKINQHVFRLLNYNSICEKGLILTHLKILEISNYVFVSSQKSQHWSLIPFKSQITVYNNRNNSLLCRISLVNLNDKYLHVYSIV